jgi:hypothetical protein
MVVVMLFIAASFQYRGRRNVLTSTETTCEVEGRSQKKEVWSMAMVVVMPLIVAMLVV